MARIEKPLAALFGMVIAIFTSTLSIAQDRRMALPPDGSPSRRVALVVGNDGYSAVPLANAVNDAWALAHRLGEVGFEVDQAQNVNLEALERAVDRFVNRLDPGDVGLFFYSGHGMQIDGVNYLIPIGFRAQDETAAKYRALPAEMIRERMEARGTRLSIIVLDACRDNPFRFTRSGGRGLATMQFGRGTLIAFATAPGKTASDNPIGKNGLFTHYLLETLRAPGLDVEEVFKQVREKVDAASGQRQTPWVASSVIGEFHFTGGGPSRPVAPSGQIRPVGSTQPGNSAADTPSFGSASGWRALESSVRSLLERQNQTVDEFLRDAGAACESEDEIGCYYLAVTYSQGLLGVEKDVNRGLTYFRVACEFGYARSCNDVGWHYGNGIGVEEDNRKAVEFYRRSCDAGDAAGCWNLGMAYHNGEGVARDQQAHDRLMRRACELGFEEACGN